MSNRTENIARVNKVKKYIAENLENELPLSELAEIANFSPFHFQRVFKSIAEETPKQYIKRLRLEASAHFIVLNPGTSLLEVAIQNGFGSIEAFSRAFKNYYGLSPDNFRKESEEDKMSRIYKKTKLNEHKVFDHSIFITEKIEEDSMKLEIEIVKTPPTRVIYTPITLGNIETVVDSYKAVKRWASARNLINSNTQFFGLLNDFPAFTALDKCRFQSCVSVEVEPNVSGEIMYMELPSMLCAKFEVYGGINEIIKAIMWLATHWLPESGYKIKHVPIKMVSLSDPTENYLHDISHQVYLGIEAK